MKSAGEGHKQTFKQGDAVHFQFRVRESGNKPTAQDSINPCGGGLGELPVAQIDFVNDFGDGAERRFIETKYLKHGFKGAVVTVMSKFDAFHVKWNFVG